MGFKEECERVKRETDLLSYVQARTGIEFKRLGNTQRAKECPFCGSSKGFNIKAESQYFFCFSCGNKGSTIDFEMELSHCDAPKSLEIITGGRYEVHSPREERRGDAASKKEKPVHGYIWEKSRPATEADLLRWLTSPKRGFGKFAEEVARLLLTSGIRFNDYKRQDCLVFPIRDARLSLVAVHKISIDGSSILGDANKISIGPMTGAWHIDRGSAVVFVVESAANALSLAAMGYSAAALMSVANLKNIEVVKSLFPGKRVVLWMDKSDGHIEAQQRAAMAKHQVDGIFWEETRPDKFDVNDLLKEVTEQFPKAVETYLAGAVSWERERPVREETSLPYEPPSVEAEAVLHVRTVQESLAISGPNLITLLIAGTGVGKTKEIIKRLAGHIERGEIEVEAEAEMATQFTDTINSVDAVVDALDELGLRDKVARVVADSDRKEGKREDSQAEEVRQVQVSCYQSYLGLKGHTNKIYAKAGYEYIDNKGEERIRKGLTTSPTIFCDEIQNLFESMRVEYPLACLYVAHVSNGETIWRPCGESPGWKRWFLAWWPKMGEYSKFSYLTAIEEEMRYKHVAHKDLGNLGYTCQALLDPASYKPVIGTLFAIELPQRPFCAEIPEPENKKTIKEKKTEQNYINELLRYLYRPRILCEFPIMRASGQPLTGEAVETLFQNFYAEELPLMEKKYPKEQEKAKELAIERARERVKDIVQFPHGTPYVPVLSGYNLLPLVQVLSFANRVIMFSATFPKKYLPILQYVADEMEWTVRKIVCDDVPVRFPVTVIKTERTINQESLAKTIGLLAKGKAAKSLVVAWTIGAAKWLYKRAKRLTKDVSLFFHRDYETRFLDSKSEKGQIVTYGGAAILQGENFPEHNVLIIDGGKYWPRAALDLPVGVSKEEVVEVMMGIIQDDLIQDIGRELRDAEANQLRSPGITIISRKRIVAVIHNLPKELMGFKPDMTLLSEYTEYTERKTFRAFSGRIGKTAESLVETILNALQGKPIENWAVKDAEALAEKPRDKMSKAERKAIQPTDQKELRQQQKLAGLEEQARGAAKAGMSYREFYAKHRFVLDKLSLDEETRLAKWFTAKGEPGEDE